MVAVEPEDTKSPDAAEGENLCPECSGSGRLDGKECQTCSGTGTVIEPVGGA